MKDLLNKVKGAAIVALTMGFALGGRAENVAEVTIDSTTTQYSDLSTAWSACNSKDATLKLLKDVDITSMLNKSWTTDLSLDLGGHTLKQTGNNRIIQVLGKMTVSNGVLTRSGGTYSDKGAGIYVCYNDDVDISKFVMRGVTMTNCVTTSDGGAIYAAKNTQVMLENCTLRQNGAGGNGGAICTEGGATADGESSKNPSDKLVLISTVVTDNTAGVSGAGVYYKYTVKGNSCFAAGTKVLMADGSEKVIEEVEEGDIVRTFDHEGGTNSTARVFMTVKEATTTQIFVLTFADGYGVRCVLSHDFLMNDGDACKYVCLSRENAADYVGKSFYAADGKWHELLSVTDGETVDEVYEIYSAQHLNSYADGLLTVPADVAHVLNIYKLGADLKADAEALAVDIAAYGLAEFAEISSKYGVSREYYDAFGVKYGYVIVGKGLMTLAQMEALYCSAQEDVVSVPPKKTALKLTTSSNEDDPLKNYPTSRLTLGTGTIVTNNLVGSNPNNIYLEKSTENSLIALANDRAGICAGVTPQWTTGRITAFYYANPGDIALFRSDNAAYAVWYVLDDGGTCLKIDAGSQVVPPAVANTSYEIWKGDEIIAWNAGTTVEKDSNVKVIYTADDGYVFDSSSATTKEVAVNTSTSVATMTPPDTPFEPAASVTASGVTTVYGTLTSAWAEAVTKMGTGATLTMLKDATVESTLTTGTSGTLTLDLNDHVLAYAGQSGSLITQDGGTLHVVDTATTRSPHYFTCDETGLWTLTNEVTELSVKGGLLTGARNSAIYYFGGVHSVSNVNFVGNASTFNGGALTTFNAIISLAITDCTFFGNVAANNGGAVSCGNVTMTDCAVERNVAAEKGGGVYVRDRGSLMRTTVINNKAKTGGGVHVTNDQGGCFPAGVKILMADGSEKAVEEVAEGDLVATFDHEGGVKASAEVFYVYQGTDAQDVFTLAFASGATLKLADRHDLLLKATRKYVTVACDNARSFIGSCFYNYATGDWDTLTGVESAQGGSAYYSLYTRGHINCVANGMLTLADDVDFYLNVYELDESLKADVEILAADIATYGLATPEDYPNIPLDDFADSNMRYARIAIGKGLTTQAEIRHWNEFDYGPIVAKKTKGELKLTTSSIEAVSPSTTYLQVGEGTVIAGNVNTQDAASNAYLDQGKKAVIDILSGTTDLDVGVTLSTGTGVFGWTNDVNYASSFTPDNPAYTVVYTADKTLELVSFVTVEPTLVEHATAEVYDGETKLTEEPYLVLSNATQVTVVHVANDGYYFPDGTTAKTNTVDTSKNPATAEAPAAPFYAVARSVKTNGGTSVTKYHPSLADAVDAIGVDGTGTVTMLADVTMVQEGAAWVPNGSDLTLDLAGKKIGWTTSKGDSLFYFAPDTDGKLTIMDSGVGGTLSTYCDSSEVANSALIAFCAGNGGLTVNGGTFVCSNKVGAATLFFKNGTGDWAFNGGTYKALGEGAGGAHFLYCAAATGTTRITGGTYDIRATASAAAGVASNDDCHDKITITGGDFDVVTAGAWGGAFSCRNGLLVVDGGDFSVMSSAAGAFCFLAERGGTTILSNGTFRAETTDGYAYAAGATETATLTIAGGTYSSKAYKDTAATVIGKEQSVVTLVGSPVINNGATEGSAWNLAVQLWGAKFDFTGYEGANFPSFAVFADGTYGASYVKGDMTKFDGAAIWAGYFSTRPYDWMVQEGRMVFANTEEATKAEYPWVIDDAVTFTPTAVDNTTVSVYTNGATMAQSDSYTMRINTAATVVYTAVGELVFTDGSSAVTNVIDTTKNPATAAAPEPPQLALCENVDTGVIYFDVALAVAEVAEGQTIRFLRDLVLTDALVYGEATPAFTLDLGGHSVVGVIELASGKKITATNFGTDAMLAVDSAVKPTPGNDVAVTTENQADVLKHFRSYEAQFYAKNLGGNVVALAKLGDNEGPIVEKKGGGEIEVPIPTEWREEYEVPGDEIMRPDLPTENGMPAWQNYALGLDPTNLYSGIYADAEQNAEPGIVTVETKNLDEQKLTDGFSVKYRLDTKLRDASEYVKGENQENPSFDVKIDATDPTGVYQLNAVIFSNGVEIAQSAKAINLVGLIRQTQVVSNAVVSVPWGKLAPGEDAEIAVSNVVKTANLNEGDELRVYRPGQSAYEGWVLNSDKVWVPGNTLKLTTSGQSLSKAEEPDSATIPRGSGIWLVRKSNFTEPYYLYGQVSGDENSAELEMGPNLIGATGIGDYDLNEHVTGAQPGDKIYVRGENDVPTIFEFKDGAWGHMKSEATTVIFKGTEYTTFRNVWTTEDAKVKPGIGFWLFNNSGKVEVK